MDRIDRETQLGELMVAHLESEGWDVYQEVQTLVGKVDLVAVRGDDVMALELKLNPSLILLDQVVRILPFATHVAAVTVLKRSSSPGLQWALQQGGIGWGCFRTGAKGGFVWRLNPERHDNDTQTLKKCLNPGQKVHAKAGTNKGGAWAPWRDTVTAIRAYLEACGGRAPLATVMKSVKHHYKPKNAYSGGKHLAKLGLIPGVRMVRDGRSFILLLDPGKA